MQITLKNENSSKTFFLIKAKDIPFGIIPLQAKNNALLQVFGAPVNLRINVFTVGG